MSFAVSRTPRLGDSQWWLLQRTLESDVEDPLNGGPSFSWYSNSGLTGSPVSAWLDSVGAISLTQSDATKRPSQTAAAFGTNVGLTFDGSNDLLSYTGQVPTSTTAGSILVVFKTPTTVSGPVVLVSQSDSSVANNWFEVGISSSGRIYVENNVSGTKLTIEGSTVLSASTIYDVFVSFDGTDFYVELNGVEENPLTITSVGSFGWFGRVSSSAVFSVGATVLSSGAARFFNGSVGVVVLWDTDITSP